MTCLKCNSIWLRPAEAAWTLTENAPREQYWSRKFACGNCGATYAVDMTYLGQAATDRMKHEAVRNPPPKMMLENGGTAK